MRRRFHDLPSQPLPRGRFLYREADYPRFALYGRRDDPRLWISAFDLEAPERSAGPFEPHEAVRARRIANLVVPNGCELGPWQDGLGMFAIAPLPGREAEWDEVELAWLEPSVTPYGLEDITGAAACACCAPPTYPPDVAWDDEDDGDEGWDAPADLLDFAFEPIFARWPALRAARSGWTRAAWNGHPEACPVWAPSGALEGGFFVADFELPEGAYLGPPGALAASP